ncbi:hypothetical protein DPMN_175890 [Dreissena polymorpha]|uniref:Uncharacterized protein n=1 Tax=Dreissena polymorpha TaxID=45954 RepID=A0A9D4E839_DREPO|nr:hypothetical protein DPMN_175890 [Dreissena polymorpha]
MTVLDKYPQTSTCPAGVTCTSEGLCSSVSVKVEITAPSLARVRSLLLQLVT